MSHQHQPQPHRPNFQRTLTRLVIACLALIVMSFLPGGFFSQAPDVGAQPLSPVYGVNSPHWPHINILDFGRGVKWLPTANQRTVGYEWYARHVDMMEIGMENFFSTIGEAPSTYVKSLNPTIKTFGYDFDLSICQHAGCFANQPANTFQNNLPEDQYLHFSQDTQLRFIALDGVTVVNTITVPGCPSPQALSANCRVQTYNWTDYRWLVNLKNATWRQWYADHLIEEMDHDRALLANPVNGLFLDEHGPGFSIPMSVGGHTIILSGGAIREYSDLVPRDYHIGTYNSLDTQYNADVVTWLTYLQTRLTAVGKFMHVNTAEYFMTSLAFDQNLAAKGAMIEHLHAADDFRGGVNQYQLFIDQVKQMTTAGGSIDLAGTSCYYGPVGYTAGNYSSAKARFLMWNLASYYLVKEAPGDTGKAFFNPNLCIDYNSAQPLSFQDEWLPAYEQNVGQAQDLASVQKNGSLGCSAQGYKIFIRHYSNAVVFVRPQDDATCTDYGDTTAVSVPLASPMVMLKSDGTFSAPVSSVSIRNAEAVILFTPESVPPAGVTDLRAL